MDESSIPAINCIKRGGSWCRGVGKTLRNNKTTEKSTRRKFFTGVLGVSHLIGSFKDSQLQLRAPSTTNRNFRGVNKMKITNIWHPTHPMTMITMMINAIELILLRPLCRQYQ